MLTASFVVVGGPTNCSAADQTDSVPQDTLITLERTECYGFCPSYKITITADGSVTFDGHRFVKQTGIAKSSITQPQVRELVSRFEKINYFSFRDRYESYRDGCKQWSTDSPTAITSIRISGKTKSVRHYHGCHGVDELEYLKELEQAIDTTVNSAQWIR